MYAGICIVYSISESFIWTHWLVLGSYIILQACVCTVHYMYLTSSMIKIVLKVIIEKKTTGALGLPSSFLCDFNICSLLLLVPRKVLVLVIKPVFNITGKCARLIWTTDEGFWYEISMSVCFTHSFTQTAQQLMAKFTICNVNYLLLH